MTEKLATTEKHCIQVKNSSLKNGTFRDLTFKIYVEHIFHSS